MEYSGVRDETHLQKRYKSLQSFLSKIMQKIRPKALPDPPKSWLEASKMGPAGSKIDPGALQGTIFEKHQTSDGPGGAQNRPRGAQEHLKDVPDRPKPLPNGAQDLPKSTFEVIFSQCFFPLEICIDFSLIFHCFLVAFPKVHLYKTL